MINSIQKSFIFLILLTTFCFSQKDNLDVIELNNNEVYEGKVQKIRILTIEFKDITTYIDYEFEKKDVKYIKLSNGKVIYFDNSETIQSKIKTENLINKNSEEMKVKEVGTDPENKSKVSLLFNYGRTNPIELGEFGWTQGGYNIGGGLDFLTSPNFSVMLYFDYFTHKLLKGGSGVTNYSNTAYSITDVDIINYYYSLIFKYSSDSRNTYAFIGAGIINQTQNDFEWTINGTTQMIQKGYSKYAYFLSIGTGFCIPLGKTDFLFFQTSYEAGFFDDGTSSFVPVIGGIGFRL